MFPQALDKAKHDKENDCLNEEELVKRVRPLLEQATNILRETHGAIKALDPDGTISNNATRKAADHEASKEECHLAESLGKLTGDVTKAIEDAKDAIKDMPNVKKDLGPLLDLLTDPLFQIVSGVGLLLNGVLTLLANIVSTSPMVAVASMTNLSASTARRYRCRRHLQKSPHRLGTGEGAQGTWTHRPLPGGKAQG